MRQIGIALHNHHSAWKQLPPGAVAKEYPEAPNAPWTFYRWSALAKLTPFLEQSNAYNTLDLSKPLYSATTFEVTDANARGASLLVPLFLCPSDRAEPVHAKFGPTNYAVCTGSGMGGGTPIDTDGVFYVNSEMRLSWITDGTSQTVVLSESLLGDAGPEFQDPQTAYRFTFVAPLTDAACSSAPTWNYTDPRGFSWVNGEYRAALYNHRLTPNSTVADCIGVRIGGGPQTVYTPFGWKTARSRHPGGVNTLRADGSVMFLSDSIQPRLWRALSTRRGGESTSEDPFGG
jgi:prepilin-type processing-associated H-X9-DG protein